MKQLLLLFALLIFTPMVTYCQIEDPDYGQNVLKDQSEPGNSFTDRLIYGGSIGLQFGSITLLDFSPVVGYRITPKLEAGIGATYKYYRYKDFYRDQTTGESFDLKSNILGGSVYTRYHFLENFFAHVEYERLRYNYDELYYSGSTMMRQANHVYVNSLFVGGGLSQRISQHSYFYIMALWNLNDDAMSPYSNPVIRMGVLLGK
ncbi:MAG: hypothetical protein WCQ70_06215 [Lentimicrobiaceae bacterium]